MRKFGVAFHPWNGGVYIDTPWFCFDFGFLWFRFNDERTYGWNGPKSEWGKN